MVAQGAVMRAGNGGPIGVIGTRDRGALKYRTRDQLLREGSARTSFNWGVHRIQGVPLEPKVWGPFFVVSVCRLLREEAVPFVEAPCTEVRLERPELQNRAPRRTVTVE